MADPLSVSAGIVGVVGFALHGTRRLLEDISKIKDAPETVKRLSDDAKSLSTSLSLLKEIEDTEWESLSANIREQSAATVESCREACEMIHSDLHQWTKRSKGGSLAWIDRVNVGFFRDRQLKAYSGGLQTYKLSFSMIVEVATLHSSARQGRQIDDLRNEIALQQSMITIASGDIEREIADIQRTLAEMQLAANEGRPSEENDDLEIAVESLKDLAQGKRIARALLQELLFKSQADEIPKSVANVTYNTFGANNHGMQIATANKSTINWNPNK